MEVRCFLVFNSRGAVRINKERIPELKAGEYAIDLNLHVADSLFERPIPEAHLEVGEEHAIAPNVKASLELPDGICSGRAFRASAQTEYGRRQFYRCESCLHEDHSEFGPHWRVDEEEDEERGT